jgi:tetratricopeptide (TPR) repeat protein/transglutaminase-like putative cysteine protease
MRSVVVLLLPVLFLSAIPAHALPATPAATPAKASYEIRSLATRIDVEPDGRFRTHTELTVALSDASAVERWGSLSVPYQLDVEDVRLADLRVTRADGREKTLAVPASEDVTLTGTFDGPVYSDIRIRHFTIPSLEPGDVLHYRVDEERRAPLAPGHFWTEHRFTRDVVVEAETLELLLPAGRRFIVKARDGAGIEVLPFDAPEGRQGYRWRHRQPSVPEPGDAELAARAARVIRGRGLEPADVQVTSFEDWKAVADWYAGLARPQSVADDAVKREAATLTARLSGERERLTALHRFVAQSVRYVSLAFGIGRYQPRPASLVLSTQYGDCKDKQTLLQAMAAAIGIEAEPVLIASQRALDADVPSPAQFDHVITMVRLSDGGTFWMDGTAAFLPPGSLAGALLDKQALRAGGGQPLLVRTPPEQRSTSRTDLSGRVGDDGRVTLRVRNTLTGDMAAMARAALADVQETVLVKAFDRMPASYGLEKDQMKACRRADARDLAAPFWVEADFEFGYTFDAAKPWTFWLPTARLTLPDVPEDATAAVDMPFWTDQEVYATLEVPPGMVVRPPLPVVIDRDAVHYSSKYGAGKGVVTLERRLAFDAPTLTPAAFDGFAALKRAVESDYGQRFSVEPFATVASSAGSDADRLVRDGIGKIDAREYVEAERLLRRALELKPDHKTSWLELGRALHGQKRYDEAIAAYDKQIALNAFDPWAWNNRGWSEWSAKRLDAAEASFRKQIEIDPLHTHAHTNLGNLLVGRKRWPEARAELEIAARLQPENGSVHLQLAKAIAETGAKAEALPIFDKAVALAKNPGAFNDAAWYLVEHDLDLDRALSYARSAVSGVTAASNVPAPDAAPPAARAQRSTALAAYWDTLGWVQFKRGETSEALRYLWPAWHVHQNAEVGEHLGRALERAGKKREALLTYKAALSMRNPSDALAAAARALAKNPPPGRWTADGSTLAAEARSHSIARPGDCLGTSDVFLAIDEAGRVVEAREIAGDAFGEPVTALVGTKLSSFQAPDQAPLRVEVLAELVCPSRGPTCTLELRTGDEGRDSDRQ